MVVHLDGVHDRLGDHLLLLLGVRLQVQGLRLGEVQDLLLLLFAGLVDVGLGCLGGEVNLRASCWVAADALLALTYATLLRLVAHSIEVAVMRIAAYAHCRARKVAHVRHDLLSGGSWIRGDMLGSGTGVLVGLVEEEVVVLH
jgi:hypothetical protein